MTDHVNDELVNDLTELINENPGKTKLFFQLRDSSGKHHVLLRSKREGIDVKNKLIDYINTHDGLAYSIN
jgi:DNA polymerase-3 subunit alpha